MYKSKLQELCQKHGFTLPVYTSEKDGPAHRPTFTATVTVNGKLFQTPTSECRSSKEAQNSAAKLAFEFLGSGESRATMVDIGPIKEVPHQNTGGDLQNTRGDVQNNGGNVQNKVHLITKGLLHMYKNRLLEFVQKNNLSPPIYNYEVDGPPHCRQFKASVIIDGRTYQCTENYPTMKDAEHAAAKVALESLSAVEIEESDSFFKSLLQELVQKEGHQLPLYSTNRSGLPHMPTFVSTVVVGGVTYQGKECKTKKQSEMSAAKVAYEKFINLKVAPKELGIRIASPDTSRKTADENCQDIGDKMSPKIHLKRTAGEVEGWSSIVAIGTDGNGSAPVLGCGVIDDILQNHKDIDDTLQNYKAEGIQESIKRYKSSNQYKNHPLPEPLHPSPPLLEDSSSVPDEMVKRVEARLAEVSGNLDAKILISRHGSSMDVPEGAPVVHDFEGWMAVKMKSQQDDSV